MKTIHKFQVNQNISGFTFAVNLPKDAVILHAHTQILVDKCEHIFIWAEVDTNKEFVQRKLECYPTGAELYETKKRYIDSVHFDVGQYVFHIYEVLE